MLPLGRGVAGFRGGRGGRGRRARMIASLGMAKAKRLALATDAFGRWLSSAGERGYLYFQTHLELRNLQISPILPPLPTTP